MSRMSDKSQAVDLSTPVQFLKGCGAERAELFSKLGISTIRDLMFFFPRDYQDLTELRTIDQLEDGSLASVLGTVEEVELADRRMGRSVLGVLVRQENQFLRAVWFNQPFLRNTYRRGQTLLLSGKPKWRGTRWEMVHPHVQVIEAERQLPLGQLVPIYPLTEGLAQRRVRQMVRRALDDCAGLVEEVFPPSFLEQHSLWPIRDALTEIHFPVSRENLERARARFIYQELLILQLALALKRQQVHDSLQAFPLEAKAKIDARIRRLLPFELTAGQNQAIAEIAADMGRTHPMNRLLQGDVGSGKTIVAVYAMLLTVAHQAQVVLMAPTEVLARQHVETLERLLAGSHTRLGLLTGGQTPKARQHLFSEIASGAIQIIIGTQAVVANEVPFARLGLVVIDEQHKFGVRQRAALKRAGVEPHYLIMTATPIPRTVTMTLFGDLDTTVLADSPPGRQNVHTYLAPAEDRAKWWEFFRKKLREGRQGYVIVPLVEGSDSIQAASLDQTFEALANGELEAFRIGLIHGRMTPAEKQAVMAEFRHGDIQVLIATSVVEVGVDVPNATLMTIEGAERFGLAQLHQLRGRVSRGCFPGYCCVFADAQSDDSRQRIQAFVECRNGFELAEIDFRLRGPGDLLGTQQHGLPRLRIADLMRDGAVVEQARRDAQSLVTADPGLAAAEHALLRRMALVRYGRWLELGDVG